MRALVRFLIWATIIFVTGIVTQSAIDQTTNHIATYAFAAFWFVNALIVSQYFVLTKTSTKTGLKNKMPEVGDMFRYRFVNKHLAHVTEITKEGHICMADGVLCINLEMLYEYYELENDDEDALAVMSNGYSKPQKTEDKKYFWDPNTGKEQVVVPTLTPIYENGNVALDKIIEEFDTSYNVKLRSVSDRLVGLMRVERIIPLEKDSRYFAAKWAGVQFYGNHDAKSLNGVIKVQMMNRLTDTVSYEFLVRDFSEFLVTGVVFTGAPK